jgi:hypothetical protein
VESPWDVMSIEFRIVVGLKKRYRKPQILLCNFVFFYVSNLFLPATSVFFILMKKSKLDSVPAIERHLEGRRLVEFIEWHHAMREDRSLS